MQRIIFACICILFCTACRANYREWLTPGCSVAKSELTILQFSDTHVRHAADAAWLLAKLKNAIQKHKPDVLILTGDATNTGDTDQWLALSAALREIKPAPLIVWGNHDMPLKSTEYKDPGSTRYHDFGNYRLILLDTAWDGWFTGSYTSVPQSELVKLEQAANTENKILLFAHHPLGHDAPHFRLKNADAVLALFAQKNFIGAFTGHFHGAYLAPEEKILFAGVAPLSVHQRNHTWSQSKGYRMIELEKGCMHTLHEVIDE